MLKYIQTQDAAFGVAGMRKESSVCVSLETNDTDREGQLKKLGDVGRIDSRIRQWVANEQMDMDRYTYVLVVPLGADESWEETVNGDAFSREDLQPESEEYGHKTFERFANAFMHHKNKDPAQGFGTLPIMVYSDEMDRCEGIWKLDNEKARAVGAGPFVDKIRGGKRAEISMGTHVAYDVCTFCWNKAKSPAEYCEHTTNPGFGYICPTTGRKMRVLNPRPRFFDLSGVLVPAAPEAAILGMISPSLAAKIRETPLQKTSGGIWTVVPSSVLGAEIYGMDESFLSVSKASSAQKVSVLKASDLLKQTPALHAEVIDPLTAEEPSLLDSPALSESNLKKRSFPSVLSTLAASGIVPTAPEFMQIARYTLGAAVPDGCDLCPEEVAQQYEYADANAPFLSAHGFCPVLAYALRPEIPGRSIVMPHLGRRIREYPLQAASSKGPSVKVQVSLDGVPAAYLYASFIKTLSRKMGDLIKDVVTSHPSHARQNLCLDDLTESGERGFLEGKEVLSQLSAQAVLPAQYVLSRALQGRKLSEVKTSMVHLNRRAPELFGGVVIRSAS